MATVKKNLVLVGMMAVGKTTIGKIIAKEQKMEFIDTDKNIEKKQSMKINEIFEKKSEKFFRIVEEEVVLSCLEKNNCVIALGGGAFINSNIRKNVLEKTISFWLDVDGNTINKRLKWKTDSPLLNIQNKKEKIEELYNERKNTYKLANHKIECNTMSKKDIVKKITSLYEKH